MARATERPDWAKEFWKSYEPPTDIELERRGRVLDEIWNLRSKLKIAPMTTTELVRSIREGDGDD